MTEKDYLKRTLQEVQRQQQTFSQSLEDNEENYRSLKQYTVDYKNELDKYEVYNHQQNLNYLDKRSLLESGILRKLAHQRSSPYFGRVDFVFNGEEEAETFYLGRYGLADQYGEQLIYDWRAPIGSLYYEYGVGPAAYHSHQQQFTGETTRKRQYEITDGRLVFQADDGASLADSLLVKALGQATGNEMKTIITTIQAQQSQVIRDTETKNLIIQGVAGSGKTSIALHRVAFLLYQLRDHLRADEVLVLSPNQVFSSYIASVLPELGEDELQQVSVSELAKWFLTEERIVMGGKHLSLAELTVAKAKIDQLVTEQREHLVQIRLPITGADDLEPVELAEILKDLSVPVEKLPQAMAREIRNQFGLSGNSVETTLKKRLIYKNSQEAYQKLFGGELGAIPEEQLYLYLYLKLRMEGLTPLTTIKHMVIDEMQDHTLLFYEVLERLFPCSKTICGDVAQSLRPLETDFLNRLSGIVPDSKVVLFTTNYRSSYEIVSYAKQFNPTQQIDPIPRHGKEVVEITSTDFNDQLTKLKRILIDFLAKEALRSCGIICPTEEAADRFSEVLMTFPIQRVSTTTKQIQQPIVVTTITIAKGLEFDAVVLAEVSQAELGRANHALYTSCTRALHELTVFLV